MSSLPAYEIKCSALAEVRARRTVCTLGSHSLCVLWHKDLGWSVHPRASSDTGTAIDLVVSLGWAMTLRPNSLSFSSDVHWLQNTPIGAFCLAESPEPRLSRHQHCKPWAAAFAADLRWLGDSPSLSSARRHRPRAPGHPGLPENSPGGDDRTRTQSQRAVRAQTPSPPRTLQVGSGQEIWGPDH